MMAKYELKVDDTEILLKLSIIVSGQGLQEASFADGWYASFNFSTEESYTSINNK